MQATTGISEFSAGLASQFNRLNRAILVADKPQSWQPAIETMNAFLSQLETWLVENPAVIGEDIVTSSRVFSLLLTLAATGTQGRLELYQAKDEAGKVMRAQIDEDYLPSSGDMRRKAIAIAREYLQSLVFASLSDAIRFEILPLLESLDDKVDPDRFMAYRVIQIGNIFEAFMPCVCAQEIQSCWD
jgi:hypothetical protein